MSIRNFLKRLGWQRPPDETPDELVGRLSAEHGLTPAEVVQLRRVSTGENWRQAVADELAAALTRRRLAASAHDKVRRHWEGVMKATRAAARTPKDDGLGGIDPINPSDTLDVGWLTRGG